VRFCYSDVIEELRQVLPLDKRLALALEVTVTSFRLPHMRQISRHLRHLLLVRIEIGLTLKLLLLVIAHHVGEEAKSALASGALARFSRF